VSACLSLPISVAASQSGQAWVGSDPVPGGLLAALSSVEDPRSRRGVRHRLFTVLAIRVCAVLAGAQTFTAIAEWAQDLTPAVCIRLGIGRRAPSESTIRRVLQAVDAEALDGAVSAWLVTRSAPLAAALRMIAIDGKSVCGVRRADGRAVHLLAAFDQVSGIVLDQSVVEGKTNEITAFAPLLNRIDITGAIITADALHTQHRHADYLIGPGAHYVLTVKRNQPSLHRQLTALPWAQIPTVERTHDKGHGRIESRSLKLAAVPAGIGFPHAQLAIQLTRRRQSMTSGKRHTETVYAITDLTWPQIRANHLADAIRGHRSIENRLHWIRDVVFTEDHSQIHTGTRPTVMATLRNLTDSLHPLSGATNIAAACRHVNHHPNRVLPLLT
jgi:predicted transposase YbfD/YdcC